MPSPTETVQSMYAAFGRGDIPALVAGLTDDVEWIHHGSLDLPYMGRFVGKPAVAKWFELIPQVDDIQVFEPREFLAGPDHVTVLGWERTRALPQGKVFECHWMHVFQFRGDKVARFVCQFDTAASMRARA